MFLTGIPGTKKQLVGAKPVADLLIGTTLTPSSVVPSSNLNPDHTIMSYNSLKAIDSLVTLRLEKRWGRRCITRQETQASPSKLHNMIDSETTPSWDEILIYVQCNPKEVMHMDRRGRTCLSSACAKNPPRAVVSVMLKACRYGTEAIRDKSGKTALHIALSYGATIDVIQELCRSTQLLQTCDHSSNTPLHWACKENMHDVVEVLVQAHPDSACTSNSAGKTPLHVALLSKVPWRIIEMIVLASPKSVSIPCWGHTTLQLAIENGADYPTLKLLVSTCPDMVEARDSRGRSMLQCALQNCCSNPDILSLLISSKEKVLECDSAGRTALHTTLSRHETNFLIIKLILDAAPEASQVKTKSGQHPLKMAFQQYTQAIHQLNARSNSLEYRRSVINWWRSVRLMLNAIGPNKTNLQTAVESNAPLEVVQRLVEENPEEAVTPNQLGEYPLATSLKLQYHANDELVSMLLDLDSTVVRKLDCDGRSVLALAAESHNISPLTRNRLIRAYPEALGLIDPTRKLFPALIAACDSCPNDDRVFVIYELLSACPHLLRCATEG